MNFDKQFRAAQEQYDRMQPPEYWAADEPDYEEDEEDDEEDDAEDEWR